MTTKPEPAPAAPLVMNDADTVLATLMRRILGDPATFVHAEEGVLILDGGCALTAEEEAAVRAARP